MTLTITEKDIYRLRLRPAASAESSEKPLTSYDFDDPSNRRRNEPDGLLDRHHDVGDQIRYLIFF